jgi:hypothetical protein
LQKKKIQKIKNAKEKIYKQKKIKLKTTKQKKKLKVFNKRNFTNERSQVQKMFQKLKKLIAKEFLRTKEFFAKEK